MNAVADARNRVKVRNDLDFSIIDLDATTNDVMEFICFSPKGTLTKPYQLESEALFLRHELLKLTRRHAEASQLRDAEFISRVPIPGPENLYRVRVRTFPKK